MVRIRIPSCFYVNPRRRSHVTLVFWHDGSTKTLHRSKTHVAGEVMVEFPDQMVSHADSFFIGRPIQPLAMEDELVKGQTYFVLPIDRFAYKTLTTSSLSIFYSKDVEPQSKSALNFVGPSSPTPFEYFRGPNGKVLIKVSPTFIASLIRSNSSKEDTSCDGEKTGDICDTPELKKHYVQLVGSKEQVWSPKLETISEYEIRVSPNCFSGFSRSQKETTGL